MSERVTMPALGESVTEGTVTRWLKSVGDHVGLDEPLLEVSTDKVDTEIPSPVAGVLLEILVNEDDTVPVGADLALVGDPSEASGSQQPADAEPAPQAATPQEPAPAVEPAASQPEPAASAPAAAPADSGGTIEGGTTVTAMAQHLGAHKNLTVVTNGLYTTNALRHHLPHMTVITTGGILRDVAFTFVGPLPETFFREFRGNKLFLSATGLTLDTGLTDPSMLESQVKKTMIAAVAQVVVLMDSSKFGVQSLATVLHPGPSHRLITDSHAPPAMLRSLRERGVDVHVVDVE